MSWFRRKKKENGDANDPPQKENLRGTIRDIFDGSLLTREAVVKQLPYIFFMTMLAVIYIGNRYHAEKIIREINNIQGRLKELRTEEIATASELMYISKQSEVAKSVQANGLEIYELIEPPKKIVIRDAN